MNHKRTAIFLFSAMSVLLLGGQACFAEVFKETKETADGRLVYEAHLTLHPAAEPVPAMKYRLMTDPAYQVDRNANIHYLKAGGFFEANTSRKKMDEFDKAARKCEESEDPKERAKSKWNWYGADPKDLPLDEVKEVLGWLSFQPREFDEAERCRYADFGHQNVFESEDPICYLLPEIQSMRELARWQSVRCRVAIREGRIEDAIKILRQQYMMVEHMKQDVFIVSYLVGMAMGGIADEDFYYLIQEPECPSLYWALAAMPRSADNIQRVLTTDKRLTKAYFPAHEKLCDMKSEIPSEFWPDHTDRIFELFTSGYLGIEPQWIWNNRKAKEYSQTAAAAFTISAYPKARRYLIEDLGLDQKKVDSFPAVRVVAMAMNLCLEDMYDSETKWAFLPPEQSVAVLHDKAWIAQRQKEHQRIGMAADLPYALSCSLHAVNESSTRRLQNLNLMQTVEALRIYAHHHDGKLPESLEKLSPPAQKNPYTGEHFPYRVEDGRAILDAPGAVGMHRRVILEMKPKVKSKI